MLKNPKEKYLCYLFTLRKQHDLLMSNKKSSVNSKKNLAKVIQNFIDKYSLSDALKNDANSLISSLKQILSQLVFIAVFKHISWRLVKDCSMLLFRRIYESVQYSVKSFQSLASR
jgi:hypothetical protein